MLHEFNEINIETKFIKSLLASYYTPMVMIWKPGMSIIKDFNYVTSKYILLAKESWTAGLDLGDGPSSEFDSRYFQIIEPYINNKSYRNITSNYISNVAEYDSETHYQLGRYLRAYRDLQGIDLMPFYNCVNGVESNNLRITNIQKSGDSTPNLTCTVVNNNTIEDNYKVLTVPILYNTDYTIYIDSFLPIKMVTICYDNVYRISSWQSGVREYNSCSYSNPISYKITQEASLGRSDMYYHEYLTLLIQVPSNCNKVLVLEGNYSKNNISLNNNYNHLPERILSLDKLEGISSYNDFEDEDIDYRCPIYSPLIRNLENKLISYDDRLIQYLLLNVIDKNDEISDNIERIQRWASSSTCESYNGDRLRFTYNKGIFDNNLRVFLYDLMTKPMKKTNKTNLKDIKVIGITGYVDRETESMVMRGQNEW